jgi:hypothetical protein
MQPRVAYRGLLQWAHETQAWTVAAAMTLDGVTLG